MNMSEVELARIVEAVTARVADKSAAKVKIPAMGELNRQQICAALGVSESTIRRLEHDGMPFTPVGVRSKRYDLAECKKWLKENQSCQSGKTIKVGSTSELWSKASAFTASCRKAHLRVMPSE